MDTFEEEAQGVEELKDLEGRRLESYSLSAWGVLVEHLYTNCVFHHVELLKEHTELAREVASLGRRWGVPRLSAFCYELNPAAAKADSKDERLRGKLPARGGEGWRSTWAEDMERLLKGDCEALQGTKQKTKQRNFWRDEEAEEEEDDEEEANNEAWEDPLADVLIRVVEDGWGTEGAEDGWWSRSGSALRPEDVVVAPAATGNGSRKEEDLAANSNSEGPEGV